MAFDGLRWSRVTFSYRLQGRVDKLESTLTPFSHKIDLVLSRLDTVFKKRKLKKEDMEKIFDGIIDNRDGKTQKQTTR